MGACEFAVGVTLLLLADPFAVLAAFTRQWMFLVVSAWLAFV